MKDKNIEELMKSVKQECNVCEGWGVVGKDTPMEDACEYCEEDPEWEKSMRIVRAQKEMFERIFKA